MTQPALPSDLNLLWQLLAIDSPSGDEHRMVDFLLDYLQEHVPRSTVKLLGSSLIVTRGKPAGSALFSHIDTTGFTLGYDGRLLPIGSPAPRAADMLRALGESESYGIHEQNHEWAIEGHATLTPGARMVFASKPDFDGETVTAPYLDNRAGLWASLTVLHKSENCVVAFTAGEECSGSGARACARYVSETLGLTSALIADITWDTEYVHCGEGPAISLRDASIPNQRQLAAVLDAARQSSVPFQIEIESDGGSDGAHIDRGDTALDWVFVGAPERNAHSSHESVQVNDLRDMASLLTALVNRV